MFAVLQAPLLVALLLPSAAADPCGTPAPRCGVSALEAWSKQPECAARLPGRRHVGPRPREAPPPPPPPGEPKLTRDAFGTFDNQIETDNFAVKWGPSGGVSVAQAQVIADALERSWAHELETLGHPAPSMTENHRLNAYIAGTGGGVPSSYGAAGYFWFDEEGWPMLVFDRSIMGDRVYAETTAAHELYHAVQYAIDTYSYEGRGDWWFEATASWMEEEVFPEHGPSVAFLPGFALLPDLPVDHFTYPSTGALQEYHQYGAAVFVRHLVDVHGPDLIRRSWTDAPANGNPLGVLDALTEGTIREDFFEMTARNATWDYDDRAAHAQAILDWGGYTTRGSRRPTGTAYGEVNDQRPPAAPPRTFGANYWQLRSLYPVIRVNVRTDEGPGAWRVTLSARTGEVHRHHPIPLAAGQGTIVLEGLDSADEVWLSFAAADRTDRGEAAWGYAFDVEAATPEDLDTGEAERPRACGCAHAGGTRGSGAALLGFSLLVTSRRPRSRSS